MKSHRALVLLAALGCAAVGAVAPAAGCNGTGTTPMCDFPDGANNPESGCGEPSEAAAVSPENDAVAPEDVSQPDSSVVGKPDAADASAPESQDAADGSEPHDAHEDASDAHIQDAKADAKG